MQPFDGWSAGPEDVAALVEMSVTAAVKRDLGALAKRDPTVAESGLAASALALAGEMDAKNSATSKSMCARALVETLEKLDAMTPPAPVADAIDQLAARRQKRKAS